MKNLSTYRGLLQVTENISKSVDEKEITVEVL